MGKIFGGLLLPRYLAVLNLSMARILEYNASKVGNLAGLNFDGCSPKPPIRQI